MSLHQRVKEIISESVDSINTRLQLSGDRQILNTEDEILELAIEQFQKVTNSFVLSEANEVLQKKYKALFKPGHYGYGYASKIGEKFLERYSDLLP